MEPLFLLAECEAIVRVVERHLKRELMRWLLRFAFVPDPCAILPKESPRGFDP